jgi:hypothetical protein
MDVTTRVNRDCRRLSEDCDHKDCVFQCFPTIRSTIKVIATGVIRGEHACIRGIAVDVARSRPIPVDKQIFGDVVIHGGGTILVRGNEWLGHVHPAIVRPNCISIDLNGQAKNSHIVYPFRSTIVVVSRAEGANIVRLAIIIPGYNLDESWTQCKHLLPAVIPKQVTWEYPVLAV